MGEVDQYVQSNHYLVDGIVSFGQLTFSARSPTIMITARMTMMES